MSNTAACQDASRDLTAILFGSFNRNAVPQSRLVDFEKMEADRRKERGEKVVRAEHGQNVSKVFAVLASEAQFWSVYALAKNSGISQKAVHGVLRKLLSRDLLKKRTVKNNDGNTYRYYKLKQKGES